MTATNSPCKRPDRVVILPPGNPEVSVGHDHIALTLAMAECSPDGKRHARELRARLHLSVGAANHPPLACRPAMA